MGLMYVSSRCSRLPADVQTEKISFAIIADPQVGFISETMQPGEELKRLQRVKEELEGQDLSFIIVLGDLVHVYPEDTENKGLREKQLSDVHKALEGFSQRTPVFVLSGNHDLGNAPTSETIEAYTRFWGDDFYEFTCGPLSCIILNSSIFYSSSKAPEYAEAQYKWFEQQLESAKARSLEPIVFMHHAFFLR